MIQCPDCKKWFQSLGYPRHRTMHREHDEILREAAILLSKDTRTAEENERYKIIQKALRKIFPIDRKTKKMLKEIKELEEKLEIRNRTQKKEKHS